MRNGSCVAWILSGVAIAFVIEEAVAAEAPRQKPDEQAACRMMGWEAALAVVERLEDDRKPGFPGIDAWLKDFRKQTQGLDPKADPSKWPNVDVDALVTRNANFWRAYYEIAPGDPCLNMLHAGILLGCGEACRAGHVLEFEQHYHGFADTRLRGVASEILRATRRAGLKSEAVVEQGVKLHDQGDYAGAVKKYREALAIWPQNGIAHYELGNTLKTQASLAAGEKPLPPNSVRTFSPGTKLGPGFTAEVKAAFGQCRQHAPFEYMAYQGDDPAVIRGLLAIVKKVSAAAAVLGKSRDPAEIDRALDQLLEGCQEAQVHELALVGGQIRVARRDRYHPSDHPFIATSLRALAPGPTTEATLQRLAGQWVACRQLMAPGVQVFGRNLTTAESLLKRAMGEWIGCGQPATLPGMSLELQPGLQQKHPDAGPPKQPKPEK